MLPTYQRDQLLQEPPHLPRPMPADHVRWDLVADEIGEYRSVAAAGAHATGYRLAVAVDRAHLARSRIAWRADWLKIVDRCVIAEFICHFPSKTKRSAGILSSSAEAASRLRMIGAAFPGQRRTDDRIEIGMPRS